MVSSPASTTSSHGRDSSLVRALFVHLETRLQRDDADSTSALWTRYLFALLHRLRPLQPIVSLAIQIPPEITSPEALCFKVAKRFYALSEWPAA